MAKGTEHELNAIADAMQQAGEEHLHAEVIWSALQAMKADPTLQIDECMSIALNEWVK